MPDYKQMYFKLFNEVSDAIEMLKAAQRNAEAAYISNEEADMDGEKGTEDKQEVIISE